MIYYGVPVMVGAAVVSAAEHRKWVSPRCHKWTFWCWKLFECLLAHTVFCFTSLELTDHSLSRHSRGHPSVGCFALWRFWQASNRKEKHMVLYDYSYTAGAVSTFKAFNDLTWICFLIEKWTARQQLSNTRVCSKMGIQWSFLHPSCTGLKNWEI